MGPLPTHMQATHADTAVCSYTNHDIDSRAPSPSIYVPRNTEYTLKDAVFNLRLVSVDPSRVYSRRLQMLTEMTNLPPTSSFYQELKCCPHVPPHKGPRLLPQSPRPFLCSRRWERLTWVMHTRTRHRDTGVAHALLSEALLLDKCVTIWRIPMGSP